MHMYGLIYSRFKMFIFQNTIYVHGTYLRVHAVAAVGLLWEVGVT